MVAVDEPVQQVVVVATGLSVVAGSTAWQMLWLLAGVAAVFLARAGRARAAAAAAPG